MDTVRHGEHERLATLLAQAGAEANLNAKDRVRKDPSASEGGTRA